VVQFVRNVEMPDCRAVALVAGFVLTVAPAWSETPPGPIPGPIPVAYFTDNGDRVALAELRAQDPKTLSESDRMVLDAANRLGWIEIVGCNRGSNGILVQVDGRDAVLTSRHLVVGKWQGQEFCDPTSPAIFFPDFSHRDDVSGDRPAFSYLGVPLLPDPLQSGRTGWMLEPEEDWLIFFLESPISDQPMPKGAWREGEPRGFLSFSGGGSSSGVGVVIGFDGRFLRETGRLSSYQSCRYAQKLEAFSAISVDCDVSPGSSSSFFGVVEEGELRLLGMISRGIEALSGNDVTVPSSALLWNQAVTGRDILRIIAPEAAGPERPSFWLPWLPQGG
jgi:hypothetical protein